MSEATFARRRGMPGDKAREIARFGAHLFRDESAAFDAAPLQMKGVVSGTRLLAAINETSGIHAWRNELPRDRAAQVVAEIEKAIL